VSGKWAEAFLTLEDYHVPLNRPWEATWIERTGSPYHRVFKINNNIVESFYPYFNCIFDNSKSVLVQWFDANNELMDFASQSLVIQTINGYPPHL